MTKAIAPYGAWVSPVSVELMTKAAIGLSALSFDSPNQAETMVEAMKARGQLVAYYSFAGEGHGFRKAETLRRALELELDFYGRVFGFAAPGLNERVSIANMPACKEKPISQFK
jgi:hypothetical protein